jgi:DNA-binding response OmpR family regulator
MSKARIVVVEDEPAIRRGVSDALRLSGYEVTEAPDGAAGLREAVAAGVDLVLLDILLPKRDGLDVLRELRRANPTRPVILLTARGSEDDRVRGLKLGADDYVVKPFSAKELLARVEALLRRALKPTPDVQLVRLGPGTIDLDRREIRWGDGTRAELSETEAALLKYLVRNRERAVSREELLSRVWGIGTAGLETRAVDMHIARLRAKLKCPAAGDGQPEVIVTVRAHGYMAGPALAVGGDRAGATPEPKAVAAGKRS